jgi:hypothetical protein
MGARFGGVGFWFAHFAFQVGVNLVNVVHHGLERGGGFGGLGGKLFEPAGLVHLRGNLAFKMGRVFAGLDFFKNIKDEFDGCAGAELADAFYFFESGPNWGGQSVALALLEGLGTIVVPLFAIPLPALGFDLEAGGVLIAAAEFDGGLAG